MDFRGFTQIPFPENPSIVYVLGVEIASVFRPFYVGESGRNVGRLGDYVSAQFSAPTDFNVGTAVKGFVAKGYPVVVLYKTASSRDHRKQEQNEYVRRLRAGRAMLLNGKCGYNYLTAACEDQERCVTAFVGDFIRNSGLESPDV